MCTKDLGLDAQIEDQSYEHTIHDSRPILWDAACSYTYLCTCDGFMSCRKNHLYGKPSLHKEELLQGMLRQQCREKLREWYRSSVHKPTQKCTQSNGIDPVHVTKCKSVKECVIIIRLVYCVL